MKNYFSPVLFIFYAFLFRRIWTLEDQNPIATCPSTIGVTTGLNLDKISGNWYLIAGVPPSNLAKVNKCGQFSVAKSSWNTLSIQLNEISVRNNMHITFNANATITDKEIIGHWQFVGKKNPLLLGPFKNILEFVDYESHFGWILCPADKSTYPPKTKIVMILSRQKALSPAILEKMMNSYSSYISKDQIQMVNHSFC